MITLEDAQKKLLTLRNWRKISHDTGLKYFVIRRIAHGQHESIKAKDLQALSDYLIGGKNEAGN